MFLLMNTPHSFIRHLGNNLITVGVYDLTLYPDYDRVRLIKQPKGSKMEKITVGSQFTTLKSGVTGTVQKIVENPNGSSRILLDTPMGERWTTVK